MSVFYVCLIQKIRCDILEIIVLVIVKQTKIEMNFMKLIWRILVDFDYSRA